MTLVGRNAWGQFKNISVGLGGGFFRRRESLRMLCHGLFFRVIVITVLCAMVKVTTCVNVQRVLRRVRVFCDLMG